MDASAYLASGRLNGSISTIPLAVSTTPDPFMNYDFQFGNDSNYRNATCGPKSTSSECLSEQDYIDSIHEYVFPQTLEWVLIVLNVIVLIIGLLGNFLVCFVVYRNISMQSVTNIFIVNLAVADFCVLLFCLPPTVVWDVTETWFLGGFMCKLILYFQVNCVQIPHEQADPVLPGKLSTSFMRKLILNFPVNCVHSSRTRWSVLPGKLCTSVMCKLVLNFHLTENIQSSEIVII